jgi:hypothetical protein
MFSIIVLIIASHNDIYDLFITLWREKIQIIEKKHIEYRFFFVFSDPSLTVDVLCDEVNNSIFCKYDESLEPGIFLKTMAAIRYCERHFIYDSILRTNLSSFWNFPILSLELKKTPIHLGTIFLQQLDKNLLFINSRWESFFEIIHYLLPSFGDTFIFLDGAGFLLSRQMISLLLLPIPDIYYSKLLLLPDDIAISILMYYNIIHNYSLCIEMNELLIGKKMICSEDNIPLFSEVGFIRNKHYNGDRNIDIVNFKQQLDFFYMKN